MQGKLIIIEAGDGSGKATQTGELFSRLLREQYNVRKVEFPNYKSPSAALIKMYLNGEFGQDPNAVNPYAASAFYAVDRFASYKTEWEDFYKNGGIVIADRYTTSNMVHQAVKISDEQEKNKFLEWLWNFEFNLFQLPMPDCVIFLDMPPQFSQKLMQGRASKTGGTGQDIHEQSAEYLSRCYDNYCLIADKYHWQKIRCVENGRLRSVEEIQGDVFQIALKTIVGCNP